MHDNPDIYHHKDSSDVLGTPQISGNSECWNIVCPKMKITLNKHKKPNVISLVTCPGCSPLYVSWNSPPQRRKYVVHSIDGWLLCDARRNQVYTQVDSSTMNKIIETENLQMFNTYLEQKALSRG